MSDNEEPVVAEKPFCVDRAKQGRAACKKCKEKCPVGELRMAKIAPSPFGAGKMKNWHHLDCIFEQFLKQRATTKRIESPDDIDGWDALNNEDQKEILKRIKESEKAIAEKYGLPAPKKKPSPNKKSPTRQVEVKPVKAVKVESPVEVEVQEGPHKDLFFREFRRLVEGISNVSSYTEKTNLVNNLFTKGSDGKGFKGNVAQWCRLLLPGVVKRIYNLQSKQLIKLFSKIFHTDHTTMIEHLKQGDIGETIQYFFEESKKCKPVKKSILTIQEVDDFLEQLSKLTKEDEQQSHFKEFTAKCTSNDLKTVIRLIKHDLRMNAGSKHILQGVHPDAYSAYQASKDLDAVISRCLGESSKTETLRIKASITVMTPVEPMLAEACKSVEKAMKKCPNGMFAEIKYDGERVQLHKRGSEFKYFSRSLKPVLPHKVAHFKDFIPKAFLHAKDLILDSEILMIDTTTGKPLPFGTLGVHKKAEFKDASVCLFVFDCIYYNGESLAKHPIEYRKKILQENMTEIPNHIMFSEMEIITKPKQLSTMIAKVLEQGLEGLVLKDVKSIYEPGKRHWLKVKKDYLHDGAMADTADLIVLGAWYGTGRKAGLKSVFLMGCYDQNTQNFYTVTKVHTGHDDKTLEQLQTELEMTEIDCDASKLPSWLICSKTMIPDFVAEDPKKQPVWEITGAEFTQHEVHTADGISIRFPRVTKIRHDKAWKDATTLEELKNLYQKSKESTDIKLLMDVDASEPEEDKKESKKEKDVTSFLTKAGKPDRKHKNVNSTDKNSPSPKIAKPSSPEQITTAEEIADPLPRIFANVLLLVEEGGQVEFKEWLRYFTAYGGLIVKPEDWERITHVLHLEDYVKEPNIICPKKSRHVTVQWIKDCVTNNNLIDYRPYSVAWEPIEIEN